MDTTLKSIVQSLIQSIDVLNYLLKDHHRRTAIIAWHLGKAHGLSEKSMSNLVLAASLHDIGALTTVERDQLIKMDIEDPHPHARLGSYMLNSFEPFKDISKIIFYHHWPYTLDSSPIKDMGEVPFESYIIHIADRIDILIDSDIPIIGQVDVITQKITSLSGSLFHPIAVKVMETISPIDSFWLDIDNMSMKEVLDLAIAKEYNIELSLDLLEQLAFTFSKVIDCRSKFTATHSFGVSAVAYEIAKLVGYTDEKCREIRVAGMLHDIGKIGVPSEIIEKNGPLTDKEKKHLNTHAYFTNIILKDAQGLKEIAEWAAHHHETHDGFGYPDQYKKESITEEMDIIAYADIFTALSENRPYRNGLSAERIKTILEDEFKDKHGGKIFDIVKNNIDKINKTCELAISDGVMRYEIYESMIKKYSEETMKSSVIG